jgi:hypothetical protein
MSKGSISKKEIPTAEKGIRKKGKGEEEEISKRRKCLMAEKRISSYASDEIYMTNKEYKCKGVFCLPEVKLSGIVGSNPARGMNCMSVFLCVVLSWVGRSPAMGQSPATGQRA